MKVSRKVVVAVGLLVASAGVVNAQSPYAPPASTYDWTGVYVGATGGFGLGTFDPPTVIANGLVLGGFSGFNLQSGPFVYGAEADAMWSRRSDGGNNHIVYSSSLRARFGFAFGRVMVFGTGGIVLAGGKAGAPLPTIDRMTEVGLIYGAGAQFALSDSIFLRGEALFANFGEVGGGGGAELRTREFRAGAGFWLEPPTPGQVGLGVLNRAAPTPAAPGSFAGVYVGATAGFGRGGVTGVVTDTFRGPTAAPFIGVNRVRGSFVFGGEADMAWSGIDGTTPGNSVNWIATFRGRAGFLLNPKTLLYGTVGLVMAGVNVSVNPISDVIQGLAFGGGAEMMFGEGLFGRVEYLRVRGDGSFGEFVQLGELRTGIGYAF